MYSPGKVEEGQQREIPVRPNKIRKICSRIWQFLVTIFCCCCPCFCVGKMGRNKTAETEIKERHASISRMESFSETPYFSIPDVGLPEELKGKLNDAFNSGRFRHLQNTVNLKEALSKDNVEPLLQDGGITHDAFVKKFMLFLNIKEEHSEMKTDNMQAWMAAFDAVNVDDLLLNKDKRNSYYNSLTSEGGRKKEASPKTVSSVISAKKTKAVTHKGNRRLTVPSTTIEDIKESLKKSLTERKLELAQETIAHYAKLIKDNKAKMKHVIAAVLCQRAGGYKISYSDFCILVRFKYFNKLIIENREDGLLACIFKNKEVSMTDAKAYAKNLENILCSIGVSVLKEKKGNNPRSEGHKKTVNRSGCSLESSKHSAKDYKSEGKYSPNPSLAGKKTKEVASASKDKDKNKFGSSDSSSSRIYSEAQINMNSMHSFIEKKRKQFPEIAQGCLVDAISAWHYFKRQAFDKLPEEMEKFYKEIGSNGLFDIETYLELLGYGPVLENPEMKDAVAHEKKIIRGSCDKKKRKHVFDDLTIADNMYKSGSCIFGTKQEMNSDELNRISTHLKENYPNGAIVLSKAYAYGGGGHFTFFHQETGFITGGSMAYREGKSGISLTEYIKDRCMIERMGALYIFKPEILCGKI